MNCPKCGKEAPPGREMCPGCGAPIKPIPIPPGGRIRFGEYDWYVLDKRDGRVLILSERVIEKRAYHGQEVEVTWETCDLRKCLNGDFYYSFSASDRARIIEVINKNNDNPWYGTNGGSPTTDRIFLLSIEEVVRYFGDSGQLETKNRNPGWDWCKDEFLPWLDDQYNIARRAVDDAGIVWHWRLRSPGANGRFVATVTGFCGDGFDQGGISLGGGDELTDGHFMHDGSGYLSSCPPDEHNLNGVRPALWLTI